MEQRQAPRYCVEIPVELDDRRGRTHDVSASGVFFEIDEPFAPGALIRFVLVFGGGLRVRCEGEIVRVEQREGKLGVAVAITSHRFGEHGEPDFVA
jgi:hypothetical protein